MNLDKKVKSTEKKSQDGKQKNTSNIGKGVLKFLSVFLNIILTILLVGFITALIVGTVFAFYVKNYVDPVVDTSLLSSSTSSSTTRIYYMDYATEEDRESGVGEAVEMEDQRQYSSYNSLTVSYNDTTNDDGSVNKGIKDTYLDEAFVSIEDHRFWSHNGVDWLRTASAVVNYVTDGDSQFGGSTITQQLVKNLTDEDEITVKRKVQEICRALNLEHELSKAQILEMYLNVIYLSNNCYGVEAAANTYFNKHANELDLVECASLAAIVKNPSAYDPESHPDANKERRNTVLYTMLEYGKISQEEYETAINTDLVLALDEDTTEDSSTKINSWYVDAVFDSVQEALMEKYGYTSYVSSMMIYTGGLQIYTPMDPDVQSVLEDVYENDSEYFTQVSGGLQPESSMIIIDPYTGDVLGLVGGRGEKTGNRILNRATQTTRPPGSSIKPLSVYAPALDLGIITYGSVYDDVPVNFGTDESNPTPYPHNLPDVYKGLTTVHDALRRSVNTVAVRILNDLTIDTSFNFLSNTLHVDSVVDYEVTESGSVVTDKLVAPLALGEFTYGITLQELATGYDMFVNDGVYSESRLWLEVYDSSGNLILENDSETNVAISAESATIMNIMLKDVVKSGTASAVTLDNYVECAGKTGTSSNDYNRWFVGYTPYYIGGVWFGYDINQSLDDFSANPCIPIWDTVMTRLHQGILDDVAAGNSELKTFDYASGVVTATYCKDSGKLLTDACYGDPRGSRAETGYFTSDTVPTEYCDVHVGSSSSSYIKVNRNFPISVSVTDSPYTYNQSSEETTETNETDDNVNDEKETVAEETKKEEAETTESVVETKPETTETSANGG